MLLTELNKVISGLSFVTATARLVFHGALKGQQPIFMRSRKTTKAISFTALLGVVGCILGTAF